MHVTVWISTCKNRSHLWCGKLSWWENRKFLNVGHDINGRREYLNYWVLKKNSDWEWWLEKFLSQRKGKGYKKLLVGEESTNIVDKVPMQKEYDDVFEGKTDNEKKSYQARWLE